MPKGQFNFVPKKMAKIKVQATEISIIQFNENDFISLTDISSGFKEGSGLISKWITNKNTLEYLSIWERIYNVNFNYPEFGVIEKDSGVNRFTMSVGQWISRTAAKGLTVKSGRYGGTYAHKERLVKLNQLAIQQMTVLQNLKSRDLLRQANSNAVPITSYG